MLKLCKSFKSNINLGDFIPCTVGNLTAFRQIKNLLKFTDGCGSVLSIYSVNFKRRNITVGVPDNRKLLLNYAHITAAVPDFEGVSGPGYGYTLHNLGSINIHITSVIVAKNLDGSKIIVTQIFRTPLAHAVAGCAFSVTVLCEYGLFDIWTGHIAGENVVHHPAYAVKNITFRYPFVVICSGRGDGKRITSVSVPFRIYSVKSKRNYGNNIGCYGGNRPCGIYFTAGNIFNVIGKRNIIICGSGIGRISVMNHDGLRYNYLIEYDFTGIVKGFYFGFRYFGRIISIECVRTDIKYLKRNYGRDGL